jgi:hypothetical protein
MARSVCVFVRSNTEFFLKSFLALMWRRQKIRLQLVSRRRQMHFDFRRQLSDPYVLLRIATSKRIVRRSYNFRIPSLRRTLAPVPITSLPFWGVACVMLVFVLPLCFVLLDS